MASGKENVICYGGRALHTSEKKWGITQLECLAVLEGIKTFRVYLVSRKFKVITDHHALKWLKDIKAKSGRLARWSIMLQEYDFEIEHQAGKTNTNADALSRIPYPEQSTAPITDEFPSPPVTVTVPSPSSSPSKRPTYAEVVMSEVPSKVHSDTKPSLPQSSNHLEVEQSHFDKSESQYLSVNFVYHKEQVHSCNLLTQTFPTMT